MKIIMKCKWLHPLYMCVYILFKHRDISRNVTADWLKCSVQSHIQLLTVVINIVLSPKHC